MAGFVLEKATELNPEGALELLEQHPWKSLSSHQRVTHFANGFPTGSDWPQKAKFLSDHESHFGASGQISLGKYSHFSQVLTSITHRWAQEDLNSAVRWFASERSENFSDPATTGSISEFLPRKQEHDQFNVLDWISKQEEGPEWQREILLKYSVYTSTLPPNQATFSLVSMVESAEDRQAIVENYMGNIKSPSNTGHVSLRHKPEELLPLIEAAELKPEVAAAMVEMLETRRWQELPN